MLKKVLSVLLASSLCVCALAGCGGEEVSSDIEGKYGKGEISYPIETNGEKLTVMEHLNTTIAAVATSMNELPFVKTLKEKTGIDVEYINPSVAQWDEQFNLLFSSDDLPDIIHYNWRNYSGGGADGVIDTGFIMDLTPYLEDYAPNYYKFINSDEFLTKAAKSPKGRYYCFGNVSHSVPTKGPYLRADWLEELGLDVPETIDEWETVLTAFKEKKGATAPFAWDNKNFYDQNSFENAYGASLKFKTTDNGTKVVYGPMTTNYRDFILKMKDWFDKGLIDKNMATADTASFDALLLTGKTGATTGYISSGIGAKLSAMENDPNFDLVAAPIPVLNKGDKPIRVDTENNGGYGDVAAISTTSANKELAMRYLDYAYSDEGHLLYLYGEEGKTYTMVDGVPKYTDMILNNPDGLSIIEAQATYTRSTFNGAFYSDNNYYLQTIPRKRQIEATTAWEYDKSQMLPSLSLTAEEQKEYSEIMTEIESYAREVSMGVIYGRMTVADLENMPAKLESMGIDRATEILQTALDRFNNN